MSTYPKTLTITDLQAASMDRDALSKFRSVPVHNRDARMYYMDSEEEVRRMLKLIEDAKAAQSNVTPIEANLPHAVGEVVCGNCNHRAVSVRPVGTEPLECPECGEMAMREEPVNHALPPEYRRELEEWMEEREPLSCKYCERAQAVGMTKQAVPICMTCAIGNNKAFASFAWLRKPKVEAPDD